MAAEKIKKYRRPLNINIGLVIFGIIFVYIIICVFLYFTSKHVVGYEVRMGTLSVENVYKGIAIREEVMIKSSDSGYVNYYAREGSKVKAGSLVYSVDETGEFSDMINAANVSGENSLTNENLLELKTDIVSFDNQYHSDEFESIYDFKYNIQGTVLKLANSNALQNIQSLSGNSLQDTVDLGSSDRSGIVVYSIDGFEDLKPESVTKETLDTEKYEKKQLINNELISNEDPVFKLCTSEDWSIVIPIDETRAAAFAEDPYIKVRFLKNQLESWATVTVLNNTDGVYAQLSFNNSMITFCTDRFLDVELIENESPGLKIPNSSIVEKEFFLIPTEYITKGGDRSEEGVMKESYAEDGSVSTEFIPTTIYNATDTEYYVDDSVLRIGDYIIKPDSNDKYAISKKASLIGVYNINKGYADFKQINILYQNEEYSIVESNTQYGLNVYDYIVLDANTVNEDDIIY
ncbi:MAG: HlyD family efflux transporter periplasmic adaptor subunit [Lachnospiraceae bacterium]|nr:HlyD family efflux transporter periplasmic adaptor subunit [Lachnospiraceae bacterium]